MNREIWTALIVSVALLGQTAASALPSTCARANAGPVHVADIAPDGPHHHQMSAPDTTSTDARDCCSRGTDIGCGMSGCLLFAIPSSPPHAGLPHAQAVRPASYAATPPPDPAFPPFRPPIA